MLIVKTDRYTFSAKETDGFDFVSYILDKYEWGGAKVEMSYREGLAIIDVDYIIETNEIEDFQNYLLTKEEPSDIIE